MRQTRRRALLKAMTGGLITTTALSAGMPLAALAGSPGTVRASGADKPTRVAVPAGSANARRVILIELVGANDGLNTLVPFRNDAYYRLRPTLGLRGNDIIDLDGEMALHAALQPLMGLWERGELAMVQGLGYPAPNRSHFKSIALWESGGDGRRSGVDGWLTHDIEHRLSRTVVDAHGISLSGEEGLFHSDGGRWLSITSLEQLLRLTMPTPVSVPEGNPILSLVSRRQNQLDELLVNLRKRLESAPQGPPMPDTGLGRQLGEAVRMIRAGVDTPVYRVQLGSFDTHESQLGRHACIAARAGRVGRGNCAGCSSRTANGRTPW